MSEKETGAESATVPVIGGTGDIAVIGDDSQSARLARFNAGLKKLAGECEMDISAEPRIVDGRIVAFPVVVDMRKPIEVAKTDESITPKK